MHTQRRDILVVAAVLFLVLGAVFAVASYETGRTREPVPSVNEPAVNAPATNEPAKPEPVSYRFGETATLAVGGVTAWEPGIIVKLRQIDDSRCPADVVCIWAGELSAALEVTGNVLPGMGGTVEVRLGTSTMGTPSLVGEYAFTLVSATETSIMFKMERRPPAAARPKEDLIRVTSPVANAVITSPLTITGEARGNWYFEASFPVKLLDADGTELASHYAQAKGEWMTPDFVPFESTITFAKPKGATGTLVLQKDNPSGLPQHDDELWVPVTFTP